jgi:hypothetical protein
VAVSASSNRSESDRDPAEWMPELAHSKYVTKWVAMKTRWRLTVNPAEKRFLTQQANACEDVLITLRRASIQTTP